MSVCPIRSSVPSCINSVKTHIPCDRNARALCQSAYAVSFIHHMRPLNHRETCGIRHSLSLGFRVSAVSDRASSVSEVCPVDASGDHATAEAASETSCRVIEAAPNAPRTRSNASRRALLGDGALPCRRRRPASLRRRRTPVHSASPGSRSSPSTEKKARHFPNAGMLAPGHQP